MSNGALTTNQSPTDRRDGQALANMAQDTVIPDDTLSIREIAVRELEASLRAATLADALRGAGEREESAEAAPFPVVFRSTCPIARCLDVLGDRWSLVILRDIVLHRRFRFAELRDGGERIAATVLARRLAALVRAGLLVADRSGGGEHDARTVHYRPTGMAMDLAPVLLDLLVFGAAHLDGVAEPAIAHAARHDRRRLLNHLRSGAGLPAAGRTAIFDR